MLSCQAPTQSSEQLNGAPAHLGSGLDVFIPAFSQETDSRGGPIRSRVRQEPSREKVAVEDAHLRPSPPQVSITLFKLSLD